MQLGKYDLREELGQGGFGIVYKAKDLTLDRLVALKVLHPQLTVDPRFIENFKREARLMAKVTKANVVSIYEIGEVDGRIFIAMQYLPGGNLDQKIKREGQIPFKQALEISRQIAKGLDAGHRKDLVHRDVKPANILFDEDGDALIGDFGVAHTIQLSSMGTLSQTSTGVGTPSYRPPELWNGTPPPSAATDQYSLACVFYEMITGKILFDGDTTEQIMVKLLINGPDFEGLESEELKAVLGKASAKDPKQRFDSMREFLESLAASNEKPASQDEAAEIEKGDIESPNIVSDLYSSAVLFEDNNLNVSQSPQVVLLEPNNHTAIDIISELDSVNHTVNTLPEELSENVNMVRNKIWKVGGEISFDSIPQRVDKISEQEESAGEIAGDVSPDKGFVETDFLIVFCFSILIAILWFIGNFI